MKKLIILCFCLCLTAGILPVPAEGAPTFTVQSTPVTNGISELESLDLRFYADTPNIAYVGIKAYMAWMLKEDVSVTSQPNGTWVIARANGTTLVADPSAGTLYAENWTGFQTPELPYIKTKIGLKDTSCEWTQITDLVYDIAPTPVTFDFAKYNISMYADEEDVYLPLALVSNLLEDASLDLMAYNGEKLFTFSGTMGSVLAFVPGFYESKKMISLINGETQRAEDEIREGYAELCFITDYLYGHPGAVNGANLDEAIREKGLDAALDDLPDGKGEKYRQALHSPSYAEYILALNNVFNVAFSEGHTTFTTLNPLLERQDLYPDIFAQYIESATAENNPVRGTYALNFNTYLDPVREQFWGNETYREFGNTAIVRIDSFNPDEEAWQTWEEGKGEMPMDALGIACNGLKKAAANPDIKNFIFDLGGNIGGSQDLMQAIVGLVSNDVVFTGYNELTKQVIRTSTQTDRNMDGVIDEKDKDVSYPFNFGVLTTRAAFSCGNLFPILMQEKGAAVIGENSGGGSCIVQVMVLSDGPVFNMSSYQWHLRNTDGEDVVEKGADPDIPIERIEIEDRPNTVFPTLIPGDYSPYYNEETLDQLMNDYFAQKEEPAA